MIPGSESAAVCLSLTGLSVAFGPVTSPLLAVRDVSIELHRGETLGLVGESGCGKSTVAHALMGHLPPSARLLSGQVSLEGLDLLRCSSAELRQARGPGVAMVHQDPIGALNPVQTLGEQLLEVLQAHRPDSPTAMRQLVVDMLTRVQLAEPESFLGRYPHQASGGQLQRVVIAMALLARPRLLVLDEPTTGLDVTVEAEVAALVQGLARQYDMAVVYISHSLSLIARVCDRVGVMYAGELVETGYVSEMFERPTHPYTRALMRCVPRIAAVSQTTRMATIPGRVPRLSEAPSGCAFAARCAHRVDATCLHAGPIPLTQRDPAHWVRCARSLHLGDNPQASSEQGGAPVIGKVRLQLQGVGKTYEVAGGLWTRWRSPGAGKRALDGASLEVRAGEIVALVGESGSGKSTLAKLVIGLEQASQGQALLDGLDIAQLAPRQRPIDVRAAIQIVFQNPDRTLNPSHRVGRILRRAMRFGRQSAAGDADARVRELLERVSLPAEVARAYPNALSGGQRQRVAIARAMAANPKLILADEPVSALDASVQGAIMNLLLEMRDTQAVSVLLISHDLALVHAIADRVVVLRNGRVMESGPRDAVFSPPHHPYTRTLLAAVGAANDPDLREARAGRVGLGRGGGAMGGCVHAPQCRQCLGEVCTTRPPPAREIAPGHLIHCHRSPSELSVDLFPVHQQAAGNTP